jgi:hypothetical protein
MATWQWSLHVVPARSSPVGAWLDDAEHEQVLDRAWQDEEPPAGLVDRLRQLMPRTDGWGSISVLGKTDETCVHLDTTDDGRTFEIFVRIDARSPEPLLEIAGLVQAAHCVFVDETGRVLAPDEESMVKGLASSDAARFVHDPIGFLRAKRWRR